MYLVFHQSVPPSTEHEQNFGCPSSLPVKLKPPCCVSFYGPNVTEGRPRSHCFATDPFLVGTFTVFGAVPALYLARSIRNAYDAFGIRQELERVLLVESICGGTIHACIRSSDVGDAARETYLNIMFWGALRRQSESARASNLSRPADSHFFPHAHRYALPLVVLWVVVNS